MTDDDAKVEIVKKIYSYADEVARAAIDEEYLYEKQTVGEIIQDGKTTDYKSKMVQCLEDGNMEGYETYVEVLREEGVEDSEIKKKINDKYIKKWKDAYQLSLQTGDEKYQQEMDRIESLLEDSGFDFNVWGKNGWAQKVEEKISD